MVHYGRIKQLTSVMLASLVNSAKCTPSATAGAGAAMTRLAIKPKERMEYFILKRMCISLETNVNVGRQCRMGESDVTDGRFPTSLYTS